MKNIFLPIKNKKIGIIGAGTSGIHAAKLANYFGAEVFLSDSNKINKFNIHGIEAEFGKHSDKILKSDFIIKSPGVPQDIKIISKANDLKIPVFSEIEFASWFTKTSIIGITGTNGKTTTVELINDILNKNGFKVLLGGNIGIPFSKNVLLENKKMASYDFHLLEISSFQLEDIKYLKPNYSIIINIKPDHLDRYKSFTEYKKTKFKISLNLDANDTLIINDLDTNDLKIISNAIIKKFKINKDKVYVNNESYNVNLDQNNLKGEHNLENILVANILCSSLGIDQELINESIKKFTPLNHRIERVNTNSHAKFYNDSKATNLPATIAAIKYIKKNIILILGGIDKNNSEFAILAKYVGKIKKIILYGDSRYDIKKSIKKYFDVLVYENFYSAVIESIKLSKKDDNVLLSPACASYDQFKSYKHRGKKFKEIVNEYYDK